MDSASADSAELRDELQWSWSGRLCKCAVQLAKEAHACVSRQIAYAASCSREHAEYVCDRGPRIRTKHLRHRERCAGALRTRCEQASDAQQHMSGATTACRCSSPFWIAWTGGASTPGWSQPKPGGCSYVSWRPLPCCGGPGQRENTGAFSQVRCRMHSTS